MSGIDRRTPRPLRTATGPARLPAAGAVGRLDRVRREGVAAQGRARVHARPDDLLQLRGGLRAARLRRQGRRCEIRKLEGNPRHPGSRGRNCAKGPATLNQVYDPERILYPLKRAGRARRGAVGARDAGTRRSTTSPAASARRSSEGRRNEVMYHVGRPGRGRLRRARPAGLGRRRPQLHTNICSSGARARLRASGCGFDRPSPDHANARVHPAALLAPRDRATTSTRTPSGSSRASRRGAKLVVSTRACRTPRRMADYWLPAWPGTEAAILLAIAPRSCSTRHAATASSCAAGSTGRRTCRARAPGPPSRRSTTFVAALDERLRATTRPSSPSAETRRRRRRRSSRSRARSARAGTALSRPHLARRGGRQPAAAGRSRAACSSSTCSPAASAPRAAPRRTPGTSSSRAPSTMPPRARRLERAALAARVPARPPRDELPPAALPQGRPRPARRLLHPRLQPGLDQPRRLLAGSRCCTDEPTGRLPRRADADLERDGLVRRLRAADGPRRRAPRHRTPTRPTPGAGSASASRCCASRCEQLGQTGRATPTRPTPARCGRRTSSGSSCPGASTPTARSASASYFESPYRPGEKITRRRVLPLDLRERGARPAREGRRRGARRRWTTCASTARRDRGATSTASTSGRPTTSSTAPSRGRATACCASRPPTTRRLPLIGEAGAVGVRGRRRRAWPASRRRRASSSSTRETLRDWGWPEHAHARLHPQPRRTTRRSTASAARCVLLPTFRLPTLIHTRSGNAKWLNEISHTQPAAGSTRATPSGSASTTGDLVRVDDRDRPLRDQGAGSPRASGPGVVACSPPHGPLAAAASDERQRAGRPALVDLDASRRRHAGGCASVHGRRAVRERRPGLARGSGGATPACTRTSPSRCSPTRQSGMHCWHQKVRVRPAEPGDRYGDIFVDTPARARSTASGWP